MRGEGGRQRSVRKTTTFKDEQPRADLPLSSLPQNCVTQVNGATQRCQCLISGAFTTLG